MQLKTPSGTSTCSTNSRDSINKHVTKQATKFTDKGQKDTFLFRPLLKIVGGVLNLFCITGEVIGINDLKFENNMTTVTEIYCF